MTVLFTRFPLFIALLAMLTLPQSRAAADDLNRAWLPSDVQSIAHFDVQAFTRSTIGRIMLNPEYAPDVAEARSEMKSQFGIDLFTDALTITGYNRSAWGDEGGALIITATDAVDRVVQRLIEQPEFGYQPRIVDGRTLHTWSMEESDPVSAYIGPLPNREDHRLVILSDRSERVMDALETIEAAGVARADAPAEAAAESNALLQIAPPTGAMFYAASLQVDRLPDFDPRSQVLREARQAVFIMHEDDDAITISELTLLAESEQQARDINDVTTGMLALARLLTRDDNKPELAMLGDLVRAVTIRSRDRSLVLRVELTETMIRNLLQQQNEH